MEPTKFKELLLNIAVCAIACDGVVDEREIEALYKIEKDSPYFSALDLSESLEKSLEACSNDLNTFKKNVFDLLEALSQIKGNIRLIVEASKFHQIAISTVISLL